jgi:hypothetical protein
MFSAPGTSYLGAPSRCCDAAPSVDGVGHLAGRRKPDRISRLRADTEVLRGRRADELTRSSHRASWLFMNSIPEDLCLVGVHALLVAVPRRMTLPLAGPGPCPRREDSRSNMRSVRLGPSYCRQRIGAFPINASRAVMAAMARQRKSLLAPSIAHYTRVAAVWQPFNPHSARGVVSGVQAAHRCARPVRGGNRRDVVLGFAGVRADNHLQDRLLAQPRRNAVRSDH